MDGTLNYIKKLEEENKQLEKLYKIEKLKNVLDEQSLKEALEEMEKEYVPISVIQNKIDEIKSTSSQINGDYFMMNYKIDVLQEILNERNEGNERTNQRNNETK